MKKLLSKPKFIIPLFAIVVFIGAALSFKYIGQAPQIPSTLVNQNSQSILISGDNIALSFSKNGQVAQVLVKNGDAVKSGQIIAKLSAPDAEGAVAQAKGALDLAQAQYASMSTDYATTKAQQDLLVANAYKTLLSGGLEAVGSMQDSNKPTITGVYSCGKEGSYIFKPYASADSDSGFSLNYSGLETGTVGVKYNNAVSFGACGLEIKFDNASNFNPFMTWTISIPNTKSSVYRANKNAYDLAVNTREKVLTDLTSKIGDNPTVGSVAKAQVDQATGAYQAALGSYQNSLIISPVDGVVTFVDPDLTVGQFVTSGKSLISISKK